MSDEVLQSRSRWAFWTAVAICLVPLVPYAILGGA
jgi:nitrate reductase NapE component